MLHENPISTRKGWNEVGSDANVHTRRRDACSVAPFPSSIIWTWKSDKSVDYNQNQNPWRNHEQKLWSAGFVKAAERPNKMMCCALSSVVSMYIWNSDSFFLRESLPPVWIPIQSQRSPTLRHTALHKQIRYQVKRLHKLPLSGRFTKASMFHISARVALYSILSICRLSTVNGLAGGSVADMRPETKMSFKCCSSCPARWSWL